MGRRNDGPASEELTFRVNVGDVFNVPAWRGKGTLETCPTFFSRQFRENGKLTEPFSRRRRLILHILLLRNDLGVSLVGTLFFATLANL